MSQIENNFDIENITFEKFSLLHKLFSVKEFYVFDKRRVKVRGKTKIVYTFGAGGYAMEVELIYT